MTTEISFARAENLFREGKISDALRHCELICTETPRHAGAWFLRAHLNATLENHTEAARCFQQLITLQPNNHIAYRGLAGSLMHLGQTAQAIEALEQATAINTGDPQAWETLGVLLCPNDADRAIACFRQALALKPGLPGATAVLARELQRRGEIREAARVCRDCLTITPESGPVTAMLLECLFLSQDKEAATEVLRQSPLGEKKLVKILYRLAKKLMDAGSLDAADCALQTTVRHFPSDAYFQIMLGDCELQLGRRAQALDRIRTAASASTTIEAGLLAGRLLSELGEAGHAVEHLTRVAHEFPAKDDPVVLLARTLGANGQYREARLRLEEYLCANPGACRVMIELADMLNRSGKFPEAGKLYREAIATCPDNAVAHHQMGVFQTERKAYKLARHHFRKALALDPGLTSAKCGLAHIDSLEGNLDNAMQRYDEILASDPACQPARAGKAALLERQGRREQAYRLVRPAVDRPDCDINSLLSYARCCSVAGEEPKAVERIEARLSSTPEPGPSERMHLHFAAARLLDKQEQYARAFQHFRAGNALNPLPFDRDAHARLATAIRQTFGNGCMEKLPRSTNDTEQPVFIVGMPRSGTTLTERILAAHSKVFAAGELEHISEIAGALHAGTATALPYPYNIPGIDTATLDRHGMNYLDSFSADARRHRVILDKMPSNFLFLGLIELLFPRARIIHCERHPVDTALSCYFQHFSHGQQFSYDQSDIVFYYKCYRELMAHWENTITLPIMKVQYEDLVLETESTTRALLEFIGLEWEPGCLDFHTSTEPVLTASYEQVRRPVYDSSINRWRHYAPYITTLIDGLASQGRKKV